MEFMKKFNPQNNVIKDFNHWIVLLREKQVTLGSVVIVLKRNIPSISQMNSEEAAEFPIVIEWYEQLIRELYGAEKFNYVIAMMKDNFVHYHAFPRYSKTVSRYGIEWVDVAWPKVIEFLNIQLQDNILEEIKIDMRK